VTNLTLSTIFLLCATALIAGWVDAVVGGGGLLQVPALLIGLPELAAVSVLATNKAVAIVGTTAASAAYMRNSQIDVRTAARIGSLAIISSATGAFLASDIDSAWLRPIIIILLALTTIFLIFRPSFGATSQAGAPRRPLLALAISGGCIGFYDGLLGPGTGTFLVISLVALLGLDLVTGSATAKVVNVGANLGGLTVFAVHGHVLWTIALIMATFNLIGAALGARTALRRGSKFLRILMLVVMVVLVARLSYEQWWG